MESVHEMPLVDIEMRVASTLHWMRIRDAAGATGQLAQALGGMAAALGGGR